MLNNKFILVLRTLNSKELKAFPLFLDGLYKKQTVALKLFDFISQYSPKFDREKQMTLERAHEYVFGKKLLKADKKGRKNLLNSLSDLNKWLAEFLILQEVQKKKSYESDLLLLKIYQDRNCREAFSTKLKAFHKSLDEAEELDVWYHWYRLRADHMLYYSNFTLKIPTSRSQFLKLRDHLENFNTSAKLKYACEATSRQNILKEEYLAFFDELEIEELTRRNDLDIFQQAYLAIYQLTKANDKEAYFKLRDLLLYGKHFTKADQRFIFGYLNNYCSKRIREGVEYYGYEVFIFHQYGVENELVLDNGIFHFSYFNNIIDVACNVGQIEWAEDFIDKWSGRLDPNKQKKALDLGLAQIAFSKKDFDRTIEILRFADSKDVFYYLRVRMLLLASYYEKEKNNDIDFVFDAVKAFDAFLQRNQSLGNKVRSGAKNYSRFVKKLVKYKKGDSKLKLFDDLDQCETIVLRGWLEEKILNLP